MAFLSAALASSAAMASPRCANHPQMKGNCILVYGYLWRAREAPTLRLSNSHSMPTDAYAICDGPACRSPQSPLPENVSAMLSNVTAGHKLEGQFRICRFYPLGDRKAKKPSEDTREATCIEKGEFLRVVSEDKL